MAGAMAAQVAFKFASNWMAGNSNRNKIREQNRQVLLNNIQVTKETAQEISGMLAGQVALRMQASDARKNATTAGMLGVESLRAEAGASGVMGASVDAAVLDTQRQVDDTLTSIEQSVSIEGFNLTQRLRSLVAARKAQLGQTQRVPSGSSITHQALIGAVVDTAGNYASNYFQYGASK